MNEKEIAEIRRHYRYDRSNITRIGGCEVNKNKEIISEFDQSIGMMSEEDANGMLGLLKKALSGSIGRNLLEINFTTDQVNNSEKYALISKLKASGIKDAELRAELYNKIIESFEFDGSYIIILGYDEFDVFDMSADAMEQSESTSVFSYMICAICPIKEGKVQMSYYSPEKCFRSVTSDSVVSRPEFGLVFLVGAEETIFPSYRSVQTEDDLEEERRLMYVAITRAKRNLFVVMTRQRMLFGQTQCNMPSRFLREIDSDLLYKMGTKRPEPAKGDPSPAPMREDARKEIASALSSKFTKNSEKKAKPSDPSVLKPEDLAVGMLVTHDRFGAGTILQCEHVGGDALITVDFDGMRKNMLARAAGLKRRS